MRHGVVIRGVDGELGLINQAVDISARRPTHHLRSCTCKQASELVLHGKIGLARQARSSPRTRRLLNADLPSTRSHIFIDLSLPIDSATLPDG